jgi:predicted dinucleotide-binding enzyme
MRLAREAGPNARAGSPADAARDADAVLVAVHWSKLGEVLRKAGPMTGRTVITCSLPMSKTDSKLVVARTSSGAEALAKRVRGHVVSAFGTVPSEVLFDVFESKRKKDRPSLMYCGDHERAKRVAVRLIQDAGFDPVDAGPLRIARYLEPFTLAIAQLAYEGKGGPRLAYRFERFKS